MMTNQPENTAKAPTHIAYLVKPQKGAEKSEWIKVGALWEHADQEGFNCLLNVLGQDIKLTIRKNKPKAEPSQG